MQYNGNEGSMISRTEAKRLLDNYENSPAFAANNDVKGILFGKTHLETILAQTGCKGVRIYYGKDGILNTDAPELVIVGTDVNGNDITTKILDAGLPCPSLCSSSATKL